MSRVRLGTLTKVDLRSIWTHEATEFTPWLANEESIALLGEAIGIALEVEAQEKNVGPFKADILCKNLADNTWVLVENQLERTDHTHLGQLMTYAAGLHAVTIVWVAARFTEEHRAALDWLNEITSTDFNFFGLEVELWRIGDSQTAPKFNVVCKPNDWSRSVSGAASRLGSQGLTETQAIQLEYWRRFQEVLVDRGETIRPVTPRAQNSLNYPIGRSCFYLSVFANTRENRIGVILTLGGEQAKTHFRMLARDKHKFAQSFPGKLSWDERPEKNQCHISSQWPDANPTERGAWPDQHQWLAEQLEAFHKIFRQPIRALNADDCDSTSSMAVGINRE